jgi:hypothetical protein
MRGARYYRPIQGSARLATAALETEPELALAERLAPGELRRVPFRGDLVGAPRVRGRCAAIPLEAFDAAGARLEPEEQGAYFQLLRLSYGEGRNFCRATKRELLSRLGTTERRLHRILDGLVRKGFVRLLHRDNRGTAFRVFLPRETADAPEPQALADLQPTQATTAPPAAIPMQDARNRALGAALAGARGVAAADGVPAAMREVAELIADGATPRQVEAAIRAVARRRAARGKTP